MRCAIVSSLKVDNYTIILIIMILIIGASIITLIRKTAQQELMLKSEIKPINRNERSQVVRRKHIRRSVVTVPRGPSHEGAPLLHVHPLSPESHAHHSSASAAALAPRAPCRDLSSSACVILIVACHSGLHGSARRWRSERRGGGVHACAAGVRT